MPADLQQVVVEGYAGEVLISLPPGWDESQLCGVSVLLEKPTESTAITLPSSKPEDHEPCKRCLALMMRSTGEVAHA